MSARAGRLTWGQAEILDWLALNGYSLPGIISIRDITRYLFDRPQPGTARSPGSV
ncbi:hypothetical protein [Micromonospora sp. LOL_027]|uniref:hypothetical protein n=1 Tax=Micromonospora sp. LOL_027 TaxID=3345419 RepID=UPI003A8AFF38